MLNEWINTVQYMDALDYLRKLPNDSVHCCVTSPPYYGLRDYSANGQIGLEDTPAAYVAQLVKVFEEVRRVLRRDGTCWVNLGDTYAASRATQVPQTKDLSRIKHNGSNFNHMSMEIPSGLKPKDLIGIPWRVAFALQDAGWWLRSDIIWHKPNPMPESVIDRPTKAHEYVFLLTKSAKYWYDADAIREDVKQASLDRNKYADNRTVLPADYVVNEFTGNMVEGKHVATNPSGRNKRTVWTAATEPSSLKHFAMFPQALIEPMILAGCPATVCSECGAGYVRVVEDTPEYSSIKQSMLGKTHENVSLELERGKQQGWGKNKARVTKSQITTGFSPTCTCNAPTSAGITLDPFMGTGTTALVAKKHGRHWLGCDVNAETVELANSRTRYHGEDKRMIKEQATGVYQIGLFDKETT